MLQDIDYSVGAEWIYEQEEYFGGANSSVGFRSYIVEDSLTDGELTKYILGPLDTFYREESRIYFWDEILQEYVMYYDFEESTSYDIRYYDQALNEEATATVVVDSVSYRYFDEDSLRVQHVRIVNSGTFDEYQELVYEGIGAGSMGIKFVLGCGLCDVNPVTTQLRCFITDSMTYNFVPYACDSTWFTTSTTEESLEQLLIYPNPTRSAIFVDGISAGLDYQLYDLGGRLVQHGTVQDNAMPIDYPGFYLLKLRVDDRWVVRRVVRLE